MVSRGKRDKVAATQEEFIFFFIFGIVMASDWQYFIFNEVSSKQHRGKKMRNTEG